MADVPILSGNFIEKFKSLGNTKANEKDNIKEKNNGNKYKMDINPVLISQNE